MPASFLCHKHSMKASFHSLSSLMPQKVKIRKACCQNRRKAFLNPKASFSTGIFFCNAPSEKGKPLLDVLPQQVTASGR